MKDTLNQSSKCSFRLPAHFEETSRAAEDWTAQELLHWAAGEFGSEMEIASAFGAEGIVLIDIASRVLAKFKVFILDTGYLFPQTIELMKKVEQRYGIKVDRVLPGISVESQAELYGVALWTRDPDLCCSIRKLEPLRKKLSTIRAWVTAIRRDQTQERQNAPKLQWDEHFKLVKINPLADWTHEMVWSYIRERGLTYNPLHDHNFPSLGCVQCTRPVKPGEDQRSGRWSGFAKQECGLHIQSVKNIAASPQTVSAQHHDENED